MLFEVFQGEGGFACLRKSLSMELMSIFVLAGDLYDEGRLFRK